MEAFIFIRVMHALSVLVIGMLAFYTYNIIIL